MAVVGDRQGEPVRHRHGPQQAQIAGRGLGGAEPGNDDPAGRVIDGPDQAEPRFAPVRPGVGAAIDLREQAVEGGAANRDALPLGEGFLEVGGVPAGGGAVGTGQGRDAGDQPGVGAIGRDPALVAVDDSCQPLRQELWPPPSGLAGTLPRERGGVGGAAAAVAPTLQNLDLSLLLCGQGKCPHT